ncbi:MAG: phosphate acetyltransferase, partial [Actinobacteria bacterium]|nr:phosphate acetyltransferase [Actinomycetota bacterium]
MKPLEVGERASATRAVTPEAARTYAQLTGDRTLEAVPGPILAGMFSQLLGTRLPGAGTNYLKQRLTFVSPARIGETLTATVEVTRVRPEKALVNLATTVLGADGRIVCEGEALVLARDV